MILGWLSLWWTSISYFAFLPWIFLIIWNFYQFYCHDLVRLCISCDFYLTITAKTDNVCFSNLVFYKLVAFVFHFFLNIKFAYKFVLFFIMLLFKKLYVFYNFYINYLFRSSLILHLSQKKIRQNKI